MTWLITVSAGHVNFGLFVPTLLIALTCRALEMSVPKPFADVAPFLYFGRRAIEEVVTDSTAGGTQKLVKRTFARCVAAF